MLRTVLVVMASTVSNASLVVPLVTNVLMPFARTVLLPFARTAPQGPLLIVLSVFLVTALWQAPHSLAILALPQLFSPALLLRTMTLVLVTALPMPPASLAMPLVPLAAVPAPVLASVATLAFI